MTARGLIVGFLICLLVEGLAFFGWRQIGRNFKFISGYEDKYTASSYSTYSPDTTHYYADTGSGYDNYSYAGDADYKAGIKKSVTQLKSELERIAIPQIMEDLGKKNTLEILRVKLSSDICEDISCRGVTPDTVRHFVEAYSDVRAVEDAHETALRNAAATERNGLFTLASAIVALFSLLLGVLNFRNNLRGNKKEPAQ